MSKVSFTPPAFSRGKDDLAFPISEEEEGCSLLGGYTGVPITDIGIYNEVNFGLIFTL